MNTFIYLLAKSVDILLGAVAFAMIVRMLLPLFTDAENNKLYIFCVYISEPFIVPFRFLLWKLNIGQNLPIDLSFTVAYMALVIIRLFLPVI